MRGAPEFKRHEQFDSIEAFWELMANHHFDDLPDKTSLHVFKDDIQPMWEDPKNISGGHFKLTTRMQETTEKLWLEVVSNFLKDQFPHRDLLNGISIMVNRAGHDLVKIWVAVVRKSVVNSLREFIRKTLKPVDYFAHDVRLVPHKLVVKGAGKKIPGVPADTPGSSRASTPSSCTTSSSHASHPESHHSSMVPPRRRNSCIVSPHIEVLLSMTTVGGSVGSPAPEMVGTSPQSELSLDAFRARLLSLSTLPSSASSDLGLSSTPHTPHSQHGAEFESSSRAKTRRCSTLSSESFVHNPYGDDPFWISAGGLSTSQSSFTSHDGSLFADTPRSQGSTGTEGDANIMAPPVGYAHRPCGRRTSTNTTGSGDAALPPKGLWSRLHLPLSQAGAEAKSPLGPGPGTPPLGPNNKPTRQRRWSVETHSLKCGEGPRTSPPPMYSPIPPPFSPPLSPPCPFSPPELKSPSCPATPTSGLHPASTDHRRAWSAETYSLVQEPYTPPPITEWEDSPLPGGMPREHQHRWSMHTDSYRHEPYSLSEPIVPVSVSEAP